MNNFVVYEQPVAENIRNFLIIFSNGSVNLYKKSIIIETKELL